MLFAFILSLFAATSVFAGRSYSSHSLSSSAPSVACAQELEGIVYVPKNCAYNYMKNINKALKVQSPIMWNNPAQANSIINSFEATYNVQVVLYDAMGNAFSAPGVPLVGAAKPQFTAYERANALGEGFSANTSFKILDSASLVSGNIYVSNYWNMDGQMFNVAIFMNSLNTPSFC